MPYLFALLAGFVSAGFVASTWALFTQRLAGVSLLFSGGVLFPLKLAVVVFSAPVLLARSTLVLLERASHPGYIASMLAAAVFCSFFQGVALLFLVYQT